VNQTGTYSVLLHNTLFHGESLYEPVSVEAKFSTLLPDTSPPKISAKVPDYVAGRVRVPVKIDDENAAGLSYSIDEKVQPLVQLGGKITLDGRGLEEGAHRLTIESADTVGHTSSISSKFIVDSTPPSVQVGARTGNSTLVFAGPDIYLKKESTLLWNVTDANGISTTRVTLPHANATNSAPESSADVTSLADGSYKFSILSTDRAGNRLARSWSLVVDSVPPAAALAFGGQEIKGTTVVEIGAQDANMASAMFDIGYKKVDVTGLKEYTLDTTGLADGQYTATLTVLDRAGNVETATAKVVVANVTPLISLAAAAGIAGGLAAGAAVAWTVASKRRRA
jgi:hypothetical protein